MAVNYCKGSREKRSLPYSDAGVQASEKQQGMGLEVQAGSVVMLKTTIRRKFHLLFVPFESVPGH